MPDTPTTIINDFMYRYLGPDCFVKGTDPSVVYKQNADTCFSLALKWEAILLKSMADDRVPSVTDGVSITQAIVSLIQTGQTSQHLYNEARVPTLKQDKLVSYIKSLLDKESKIQALQEVRSITGCTLADAKAFVEAVGDSTKEVQ